MPFLGIIGFGPGGWGALLLQAAGMTVLVSAAAFALGLLLGALGAWAKLSRSRIAAGTAAAYTTVLRGVPDLLVIYLFYFGGSQVLTGIGRLFGGTGFLGLNGFVAGALAVAVVSGAYQTEVLRAAILAVPRGQTEAGRALGLRPVLVTRLVLAPQVLRVALPGMGNVWQMVVKESALVSVTGLVELMRQVSIAAGSTRRPFEFYVTGAAIYLVLTTLSGLAFAWAERRSERGMARAEAGRAGA
jgi:octopine/nopaline transport system permease protein